MRFFANPALLCLQTAASLHQQPLIPHGDISRAVSVSLFAELEELARVVDISYCIGLTGAGIYPPFQCASRCSDFPKFALVTSWNTGPLLSDSCGYVALDHGKQRIIVAFRGTYSVTNTVVDLSTVPQEYVPYPGSDDDDDTTTAGISDLDSASVGPKGAVAVAPTEPKCTNCTVHMGFHISWLITRKRILADVAAQIALYPAYTLHLVGHSLGGAVAALAGLDFHARGWDPTVTTFGEPRIGNAALVRYLDDRFDLLLDPAKANENNTKRRFRRVTHIDDPVPLLPLSEWGYAMHAGEIHISKPALSPGVQDLEHCVGDNDQRCIAGQDSTTTSTFQDSKAIQRAGEYGKRDLLASVKDEIHDVVHEPWGVPSRYKLWQLFFAHRDYFWRLGLCVPGGDPLGGGGGAMYQEIASVYSVRAD